MGRQNTKSKTKIYRLSLEENTTHDTLKTVRFSKASFILTASSSIVLFILLIYCIIAFTPLRKTIPGYPDAHSKKVALENAIKIDSLESAISRWDLYVTNLRNILSDKSYVEMDSIVQVNGSTRYLSTKSVQDLRLQDSILRETVVREEQFGLSANADRLLPIEGMHFFTPIKGVVSTEFNAILHPAIDITSTKGAIVSAILDGTVIFNVKTPGEGYMIAIQHNNDVVSIYSNVEKVLVSAGDAVKAGSPIAIVGTSPGTDSSYFLHFELWHRGEARNPVKYINF